MYSSRTSRCGHGLCMTSWVFFLPFSFSAILTEELPFSVDQNTRTTWRSNLFFDILQCTVQTHGDDSCRHTCLVSSIPHIIYSVPILGKFATEAFEDVGHSTDARELMEQYEIGQLPEVVYWDNAHLSHVCLLVCKCLRRFKALSKYKSEYYGCTWCSLIHFRKDF